MLLWHFSCYVTETGRNEVQDEIDGYDDDSLEAFRAAVKYLSIMPIPDWHEPKAKKLKGMKKLYEFKYKANKRASRALGFFGPDSSRFTITILCYHNNVYHPNNAIATAEHRAEVVQANPSRIATLQIDGEDFPTDEE